MTSQHSPVAVPVLAVCFALAFGVERYTAAQEAHEAVDFRRDVLPILSENCFACHGFDEEARQAGLRLDMRDGATAAADSGSVAIVPGKPGQSELAIRITSDDLDVRMPPAETAKQLTPDQRTVLLRWIEQGANYERHWSFELPLAQTPPKIEGGTSD